MDKAGYLNRPNPLVEHSAAEAKFIEIVTPKLVLDGWSVELIRKGPSNILAKRDKEEWHLAFKNFRTHEDIVSYAIREEFRARDLLWRTYGRLVTYDNDNLTKFTLATANEIMYKAILNNIPKFLKLSVSAMLIDLQTGKILEEQTLT